MSEENPQEIKRWIDDDNNRVYHDPVTGHKAFSVTTILDAKEPGTEEEKGGLYYWKQNNDGTGDSPYWRHIREYKKNRGTLAHYRALNRFDHAYEEGSSMWTEDEENSREELEEQKQDRRYKYSILADRGIVENQASFDILMENDDVDLDQLLEDDLQFVEEEFDRICREQDIKASNVVQTEAMFVMPAEDSHEGFGGQADLLYRDSETGNLVVADIKTSSRVYEKHKLQIAAYAYAAENHPDIEGDTVERGEIIRMNPGKEEAQVYTLDKDQLDSHWKRFAEKTSYL